MTDNTKSDMTDEKTIAQAVTRRGFLLTGGAIAAAGVAADSLTMKSSRAEGAPTPGNWQETFDVVVVGSGFAGLAAAHEAKKAGASVAVLEKMRVSGGNSIVAGGIVSVVGSPLQAQQAIVDSPELLLKDMLAAGLNLNHVELAKLVADQSLDTYNWTIGELGVRYRDTLTQEGGHSVPRMYSTHNQSGSGIVSQQLLKLREMGVTPRTRAFLTRIYRDADGRVQGVQIREGYSFPDANSGKPTNIRARKAVVLATGGFGADTAFRTIEDPRLTAVIESTNQPGATAEALREALRVGCTPVQLSWIQLGPWGSPDERGFGLTPLFIVFVGAPFGLWVDTVTGKRFVNELAGRKDRVEAMFRVGNKCIAFTDAHGYAIGLERLPDHGPRLLEREVLKAYNSLEDMAAAYGIPAGPLVQTVETWNKSVQAGKDAEWGRPLQKDQRPLGPGPWYAVRITPKVHHTMGGIRMNARAQALDVMTDKPIPGLYCAGEVAGGVHGADRLGSLAILDCLVFGRIAGKNAAAEASAG